MLVIESRLEVPVSALRALRTAATALREEYPDGIGYVTVVEPGCKTPSSEARAGASSFLDEFSAVIRGSATVFLGDGLRGAVVRAVVASMMALTRSSGVPQEICGSVDDGARWLAGRVPGLDARALASAIAEVREAGVQAKSAPVR